VSKYDLYATIIAGIVFFLVIFISYKLGLSAENVLQLSGILVAAGIVSFFISKNFFARLIWTDIRYIVEISDDLNAHRLIAISGNIWNKVRITKPIIISFGNLLYADEFDEERLVLKPTWIHYKLEFLRRKEALARLKKELEDLEEKYARLETISDVLSIIEARKRIEEIEKIKKKILRGEIE